MFQNTNKNKTFKDSRIRFQNKSFKRQLKQASGFKRTPNRQSDSKINLGPLWLKLAVAGIALLVIYLAYLPNPLFIKRVDVSGLGQKQSDTVKILVAGYLAKHQTLPQNNILLLSKSGLQKYLLDQDRDISQITEIKKSFPSSLKITVEMRLPTYLIFGMQGNFVISNDFQITDANSLPTSSEDSLIQIKFLDPNQFKTGDAYPNSEQLIAVSGLQALLPEAIQDEAAYYEIQSAAEPDLTVITKTGWKILLDYTSDIQPTLQKLHLLLNSLDPNDLKRLAYIDMRIKNRGYVCLKGTPCAVSKPVIISSTTTASSTLDVIKN